jgi:hypothetical protein
MSKKISSVEVERQTRMKKLSVKNGLWATKTIYHAFKIYSDDFLRIERRLVLEAHCTCTWMIILLLLLEYNKGNFCKHPIWILRKSKYSMSKILLNLLKKLSHL